MTPPNEGNEDDGGGAGAEHQLDIPSRVVERGSRQTSGTLFWEAFVRAGIAFLLLAIFAGTVFWALQGAGHKDTWPHFKEALSILLPAETGLLGSAVGYYYGTRKSS